MACRVALPFVALVAMVLFPVVTKVTAPAGITDQATVAPVGKLLTEYCLEVQIVASPTMATLVLSPYIHFYNSSGVVALAAKYNVPIVVSKSSIAGDITLKYGLGKVVNPFQPAEIAECISYFIKNDQFLDGSKYLNDFSSDIFCRKLLQLQ